MKRKNMYIPDLQDKRLKELSKKLDTPVSEIVRRAIDKFLDEHDEKERLKNKQ